MIKQLQVLGVDIGTVVQQIKIQTKIFNSRIIVLLDTGKGRENKRDFLGSCVFFTFICRNLEFYCIVIT